MFRHVLGTLQGQNLEFRHGCLVIITSHITAFRIHTKPYFLDSSRSVDVQRVAFLPVGHILGTLQGQELAFVLQFRI